MQDLSTGLAAWGVAPELIGTGIFGPGKGIIPGVIGQIDHRARTPHPSPGVPGTGPQVSFARSGLTVNWDEQYPSLLELAEACDVTVR